MLATHAKRGGGDPLAQYLACAACHKVLGSHRGETQGVTCTACDTTLCDDCHILKKTVVFTSKESERSTSLHCAACQKVIQTKIGQSKKSNRFRGKRNDRGLVSKSGVPNVVDNRYLYLNNREINFEERRNAEIGSPKNFGSPTRLGNAPIPPTPRGYLRSATNSRQKRFRSNSGIATDKNGNVEKNSEESSSEDDNEIHPNQRLPTKRELPPGSQFYAKTLKYPATRTGYPFTDERNNPGSHYNTHTESGRYQTHPGNNTFQPLTSQRQFSREGGYSTTHNTGRYQGGSSGMYPNLYPDDIDDDLDALDDVPEYDEIPSVLIYTGTLDDKTIQRALRKQQQRKMLEVIQCQSGKSNFSEKVTRNKNHGIGNQTSTWDTYNDQMLAENHSLTTTGKQVPNTQDRSNTDTVVPERIKDEFQYTERSADSKNVTGSHFTNLNHDKGNKLPNDTLETESKHATNTSEEMTNVHVGLSNPVGNKVAISANANDELSQKQEQIIRSDSPVEANEKMDQSPNDLQSKEHVARVDTDKGSFNDWQITNPTSGKESEEFIRKKRLENLQYIAPKANTRNIPNDTRQRPKPDNRDVAFNPKETHKPVKPSAFRTKLPAFPTTGSSEDTDESFFQTTQSKINKNDSSTDVNKNPVHSSARESKVKRSTDRKQSAMKLLISIGDDEDAVEPIAMRMLREQNQAKQSKEVFTRMLQSRSDDEPSSIFSILSTFLGIAPTESNPKPNKRRALTHKQTPATNSKLNNGKKNKNLPQRDVNPINSFTALNKENDDAFNTGNQPNEKEVTSSVWQKERGSELVVAKATKDEMKVSSDTEIAENRHRAFQQIKMSQSEDRLKCTSCGHHECMSQNVQKMKEIIMMAKKAGFDARDVSPDGNCMFAAVVDQLQLYGYVRFGAKSLREAAVTWLIEHPFSEDGTHYNSFMSEEWDVYLQRMMAEGEWGDHVVLRGVVETVGHTIKIMNISGDESHWTILEPTTIDVSKDGMHLVLGHVGEFHYISLRPSDGQSSFVPAGAMPHGVEGKLLMNENGQVALEGTESIEMFRDDYIDPCSDLPTAHLSYLLKHITPVKIVDYAAMVQAQYSDNISHMASTFTMEGKSMEITVEGTGDTFDGVYIPALNVTNTEKDNMSRLSVGNAVITAICKNYKVVKERSSNSQHDIVELQLDTNGVHTGFTKLRKVEIIDGNIYTFYQPKVNINKFGYTDNAQYESRFGISCQLWPECAQAWGSRARPEGFPSPDIIVSIESEGCILIPNAHEKSKIPEVEWQFCFSLCERRLFRDAVSKYQKHCYIILDALCRQTMHHMKSISTRHWKTIFLFACERVPTEYWDSNPGACILYMLNELLRCVKERRLPSYFLDDFNMFEQFLESDFREIEEQTILLQSQLELFLRNIDQLLQYPHGDSIITKVFNDVSKYKEHRSLKLSTLEVFVPSTIKLAKYYIQHRAFEEGYDNLIQAFQERLSVSTCDDSVPFQMFLPGAVSGLSLDSLVWFSAYTDKQLEGQLSKSLIRETCGDLDLVKIKDVLPADVVGSYGNTEVPVTFLRQICSFCYELAKFLFQTSKISEILPILYYCDDVYHKRRPMPSIPKTNGDNNATTENDDFNDEAMFYIYIAMSHTYRQQRQDEFIRAMAPQIEDLAKKINKGWAYSLLYTIYSWVKDRAGLQRIGDVLHQLPEEPTDEKHMKDFGSWVKAT